jgi:hypothetical protein
MLNNVSFNKVLTPFLSDTILNLAVPDAPRWVNGIEAVICNCVLGVFPKVYIPEDELK